LIEQINILMAKLDHYTMDHWVSAAEAIALLGVSRETLYAYVSRGRIRSEPAPGDPRRRRYSRDDIARLRARSRERRNPGKAAEQALDWGLPILESSITLIADGRLYYRGQDATLLARERSVAEVAMLVWTGSADGPALAETAPALALPPRRPPSGAPFISLAQSALALAAAGHPLAFDLRPATVVQTGWRILHLLADIAVQQGATSASQVSSASTSAAPSASPKAPAEGPSRSGSSPTRDSRPASSAAETIDARLAAGWNVADAADLIRAALILCADHELNVSAFTARCVASAGASPYGVTIAGLAALEGFRHGGATARIDALWDSLQGADDLERALAERLRRGEHIDGFGHPLYPAGDPRAAVLLDDLPDTEAGAFAARIAAAARAVLGERPTVDFALVALARALGLPRGAALTVFAVGRTIGWIAQAIEQYAEGAIIRPRAKYVGPVPAAESD